MLLVAETIKKNARFVNFVNKIPVIFSIMIACILYPFTDDLLLSFNVSIAHFRNLVNWREMYIFRKGVLNQRPQKKAAFHRHWSNDTNRFEAKIQ